MRRPVFFLLASLFAVAPLGCAEDEDLNATPPGEDTGGDGVALDADPPDSSVPETGEADTGTAPDTTVAPDTNPPDTIATFDTAGIDIAVIDTSILDGFVGPECKTVTECPGADIECAKRACRDGRCVIDFVAPDTPISTEKTGDCRVGQCDGAGKIKYLDDFTDTPPATGECTIGVCSMMGAGVENKGAGVPCSTGYCDGAGKCVECVTATTCPGTDSDCRKRACVANACTMQNLADGTVAATQVAGDCKIVFCDGSGGTRTAIADSDIPDDKEVCTTDACTMGVPSNTPIYSETPCAGYAYCGDYRAGKCGNCDTDADCPYTGPGTSWDTCNTYTCVNHMCERTGTPAPPGTACTYHDTYEGTWSCTGTCGLGKGDTYCYCDER